MLRLDDRSATRSLPAPWPPAAPPPLRAGAAPRRDLRLDLARGLALWFIFLDHIPDNFANWFTIGNYGFSDAAEIFVFVSGYAAVLAYGNTLRREGWPFAAARVLRRAWQLYAAHILLFVLFAAQVFQFAARSDDLDVITQMNLDPLADETGRALLEAALLRFQPTNLDILPIYILFLLGFAALLPLLRRRPWVVLAGSLLLYAAARHFGWNFAAYPEGRAWYFDPLTWQLVFVLGAFCAALGDVGARLRRFDRVLIPLALGYLAFALPFALSLQFEGLQDFIPQWLWGLVHPMRKTTEDPLRVLHLLALAYLVMRLVPAAAPFLRWRLVDPLRVCGRHSLKVFTAGIFLAFTARTLGEYTEDSNLAELGVSIVGIALLCALAYGAEWYRRRERGAVRRTASPPSVPAL